MLATLLALITAMTWPASANADSSKTNAHARFDPTDSDFQEGLLWRIKRDGQLRGFVYGTAHSGDPRIMAIVPKLESYLHEVDAICPELELTLEDSAKLTREMVYEDSTTLIDVIGQDLFDELAELLQTIGIPRIFATRLKPWAIAMMLSMPPSEDSQDVLDLSLIEVARSKSKQVLPLETVAEQIAVFEHTSIDDQVVLLKDAIEQYPEIEGYFEQLIQGYLQQDLLIVDTLMDQQVSNDEQAYNRAMTRLVDDRNKKMAQRVSSIIEESSCFVAVGMLHLPGSSGLLNLLQNEGWDIEAVSEFDPLSE